MMGLPAAVVDTGIPFHSGGEQGKGMISGLPGNGDLTDPGTAALDRLPRVMGPFLEVAFGVMKPLEDHLPLWLWDSPAQRGWRVCSTSAWAGLLSSGSVCGGKWQWNSACRLRIFWSIFLHSKAFVFVFCFH